METIGNLLHTNDKGRRRICFYTLSAVKSVHNYLLVRHFSIHNHTMFAFYHTIPICDASWGKGFWKTLSEKEKILVTNISSLSLTIFYLMKYKFNILSNFKFVFCECFQFGQS